MGGGGFCPKGYPFSMLAVYENDAKIGILVHIKGRLERFRGNNTYVLGTRS